MAKNLSLVFSGDDIEEIREGVLDYVEKIKSDIENDEDDNGETPKTKAARRKKEAAAANKAAKKQAAAKKKKAAATDDDDDFGDDDDDSANGDDDGLDDDDDDNGTPNLVDVRDALGELSSARNLAVAKKVLQRYGDVDRLEDLNVSLYAKVIEKANKLVAKAKNA